MGAGCGIEVVCLVSWNSARSETAVYKIIEDASRDTVIQYSLSFRNSSQQAISNEIFSLDFYRGSHSNMQVISCLSHWIDCIYVIPDFSTKYNYHSSRDGFLFFVITFTLALTSSMCSRASDTTI
jgi:hypothetical protein